MVVPEAANKIMKFFEGCKDPADASTSNVFVALEVRCQSHEDY